MRRGITRGLRREDEVMMIIIMQGNVFSIYSTPKNCSLSGTMRHEESDLTVTSSTVRMTVEFIFSWRISLSLDLLPPPLLRKHESCKIQIISLIPTSPSKREEKTEEEYIFSFV
jgi:hypothetical protein